MTKPNTTSGNGEKIRCSLELKRRPRGGIYLTCTNVHCDDTCVPYVVQGADGKIDEIGCDCVNTKAWDKLPLVEPVITLCGTWDEIAEQAVHLPLAPVGDGRCQLVRAPFGPRELPICKGSCKHGECRTIITVDRNDIITIRCDCG